MDIQFDSDGVELRGWLARPGRPAAGRPGLVLCHGFPSGMISGEVVGKDFPQLADRIAVEMGWSVLSFDYRGCGSSSGDFSLGGWLTDTKSAIARLTEEGIDNTWIAGFGTGGALAICAGAADERICGVAALGAPADFDDWARQPRRLLEHARTAGVVHGDGIPPSPGRWVSDLAKIRAAEAIRALASRPVLVVHGTDDQLVPLLDARVLADAHGAADLRVINGAGHSLRHDPRSVAVLLAWLDRQHNTIATSE